MSDQIVTLNQSFSTLDDALYQMFHLHNIIMSKYDPKTTLDFTNRINELCANLNAFELVLGTQAQELALYSVMKFVFNINRSCLIFEIG